MFYILSKPTEIHNDFCALGHEIHISRFIICDMLYKNFININDTIVTLTDDRKFLYTKLFDRVLSYNDFLKLNINENEIIRIYPYMLTYIDTLDIKNILDFETKSNYDIRNTLYNNLNRDFNHLLEKIDYPDIILNFKDFFVIHHRKLDNKKSNNIIEKNFKLTNKIISYLENKYPEIHIVIFTSNKDIKFTSQNISYIYSLAEYASYMNHKNCQAVISEHSGGGELSHYCHNNKIYIYGNSYYILGTLYHNVHLNKLQKNDSLRASYTWNINGITNALYTKVQNIDDLLKIL